MSNIVARIFGRKCIEAYVHRRNAPDPTKVPVISSSWSLMQDVSDAFTEVGRWRVQPSTPTEC